jgi:hypothetical protein
MLAYFWKLLKYLDSLVVVANRFFVLFGRTHKSMMVIRNNNVVGGITYRPYARYIVAIWELTFIQSNRIVSS